MSILSKWLEKRGIEKAEDLSPEELTTYNHYKSVLSGETLSIDTIKVFCQGQIRIIESKCDGVTLLTPLQQASLHVYLNLLKAIEAPEAERLALEQHLTQIVYGAL